MASRNTVPPGFDGFREEERLRDGSMRDEIVTMVVEALNAQGHAGVTARSIRAEPAHRALALDLLRDCRPLPVVTELIAEIETGSGTEGGAA